MCDDLTPPDDITGSFRNVVDPDRRKRRLAWIQNHLDRGVPPKQIAQALGLHGKALSWYFANGDLRPPAKMGAFSVRQFLDGLPDEARWRILDRARKENRTVADTIARDLRDIYK